MTISKKLFLIATIGLSLGIFNASAYDVVGLVEEVRLISAFAKKHDYDLQYNNKTVNIGSWLNDIIYSTWITSNDKIIKIAKIIKQHRNLEKLLIIKEIEEIRSEQIEELIDAAIWPFAGICSLLLISGIMQGLLQPNITA